MSENPILVSIWAFFAPFGQIITFLENRALSLLRDYGPLTLYKISKKKTEKDRPELKDLSYLFTFASPPPEINK